MMLVLTTEINDNSIICEKMVAVLKAALYVRLNLTPGPSPKERGDKRVESQVPSPWERGFRGEVSKKR
jgi:hypothetical protein